MRKFPTTELEILGLAYDVKSGLARYADIYPDPPVTVEEMAAVLVAIETACDAKAVKLSVLTGMVKKNLCYAEQIVKGDDAKLRLLGWTSRREPLLAIVPGPVHQVSTIEQGPGELKLTWQPPKEGGNAIMYRIDCRFRGEDHWIQLASTYKESVRLLGQPCGVEIEYRVIASNKAGDGPTGNPVRVML